MAARAAVAEAAAEAAGSARDGARSHAVRADERAAPRALRVGRFLQRAVPMDELGFRPCKRCGRRALIELNAHEGRVCARCFVELLRRHPSGTIRPAEAATHQVKPGSH